MEKGKRANLFLDGALNANRDAGNAFCESSRTPVRRSTWGENGRLQRRLPTVHDHQKPPPDHSPRHCQHHFGSRLHNYKSWTEGSGEQWDCLMWRVYHAILSTMRVLTASRSFFALTNNVLSALGAHDSTRKARTGTAKDAAAPRGRGAEDKAFQARGKFAGGTRRYSLIVKQF